MDLDEARTYVRQNSHAVLSTVRRDGTPQMSPVAVAVDDEGRVVVSSRETAYKTKNVRRDPRAWLCVFPDGFYGQWIQVSGAMDVLSLPEALEPLVGYYRAAVGEHEDWAAYRQAMVAEQRCLLRLTLLHAGPTAPADPAPPRPARLGCGLAWVRPGMGAARLGPGPGPGAARPRPGGGAASFLPIKAKGP